MFNPPPADLNTQTWIDVDEKPGIFKISEE